LNKTLSQLTEIWGRLGLNQRVSIILSLTGIAVGLIVLLMWSGRPRLQLLYGGLEASDMSEVVAFVEEQGVRYELKSGGSAIYVPEGEVHGLRMDLAGKGVPNGGGVGFEIFDQGNFGISDFVQRTNFIRAVQGELSRTIAQLRDVQSARVMVVVPENRLLVNESGGNATASVFVDTGGKRLDESAVNSIRFLVANSVEGLDSSDVAVVDAQGNVLSEEVAGGGLGGATSQFRLQQKLEDYYTRKIESMLTPVVGFGNVVARVSVDLDNEAITKREQVFDPDSQVVRNETVSEDTSSSTSEQPSEEVGADANVPGLDGTQATPRSQTVAENISTTTAYEINSTTRETVKGPGGIRRVQAAVVLGTRFVQSDEGVREPQPRTPEELERIRTIVMNAIGVDTSNNPDAVRLVTVEETEFARTETPEPGAVGTVQNVLVTHSDLIRNGIGALLALAFFLFFLRMIKRYKPNAAEVEVVRRPDTGNRQLPEEPVEQLEDHRQPPEITPEVLNGLIQEKPENISTTLKHWVSAGAKK
jgi:flagellar M-ring protein FliF